MQDNRTDRQSPTLDMIRRAGGFAALRRGLVDNEQRRRITGQLQYVGQLGKRLQREQVRLYRNKHDISLPSGLSGVGTRVRRGVNDNEVHALASRLLDGLAEPGGE